MRGSLKISISKLFIPLIVFLPVMLSLNENMAFNISISDVFLPIVCLLLFTHSIKVSFKKSNSYKIVKSYSVLYVLIIGVVLSINLLKLCMIEDIESISSGIKNVVKIVINLVYFSVFTYGFKISGKEFEKVFIKTWTYTSVVISILAILGVILFSIGIENSWSYYYRAVGTFNDPNLFATYLFISISITSIYNYKNKKNILGANLILNLIALLLTSSRAAIISVLAAVLLVMLILFFNGELKKISLILIKIVVLGGALIIVYILISQILDVNILGNTLERLFEMGDTIKEDSRISQWISGIKLWCSSPILGVGIGKFIDSGISMGFTKYRILAHNTYITFLSELGIIGLMAFIWFPVMLFIKLIKNSMNSVKNQVLIFSIVGVAISCISLNLENFRCMWVFLVYCYYCIKSSKKEVFPLIIS
ncbi:MAG: O-antigen ligase family protein [Paeniclostridium sordellii]|nr:O-antigen ligase family protein [Paeniclostridium sordellii]